MAQAAWAVKDAFALGGQDCHAQDQGAFTGDISAEIAEGCRRVLCDRGPFRTPPLLRRDGQRYRRQGAGAWRAGLKAIICIGETESQRDAGDAHAICRASWRPACRTAQTPANTVLAYEPVWAIGTGRTPTSGESRRCTLISQLSFAPVGPSAKEGAAQILILYGGSVKPDNANEILNLPEVSGALVGGRASKPRIFSALSAQ